MNAISKTLALAAALTLAAAAQASSHLADAEVKKVDKSKQKITLKHGELKNLDMPGMTMVFRVKDAAMLDAVKPGDKVRIAAEKIAGAITLTEMEAAH